MVSMTLLCQDLVVLLTLLSQTHQCHWHWGSKLSSVIDTDELANTMLSLVYKPLKALILLIGTLKPNPIQGEKN